jgi:hypothetical protein
MHPQMKNIAASLLLMLIFSTAAFAQTVYSLEQLRAAAKENYPEFKQKALSKQGYDLEIEKAQDPALSQTQLWLAGKLAKRRDRDRDSRH